MCDELKESIERHLLAATGNGWVKSAELIERFDLRSDRVLRGVGDKPGLCSDFAISGDKGFKHVTKASPSEYRRFKHRMRRHAIAELVRTRNLDRRRSQATRTIQRPAYVYQPDTGQGQLFTDNARIPA
jgi:hypothetical protein